MPINREVNNTLSTDATTRRRLFANFSQRVFFCRLFLRATRRKLAFLRLSARFRLPDGPARLRRAAARRTDASSLGTRVSFF
jgi:hypothetical protein